jgi:hypothetical protein
MKALVRRRRQPPPTMRNRRCATRVLDHSYRDERYSLLVVGAAAEQ